MNEIRINRATLISYYKECPETSSRSEHLRQRIKETLCKEELCSQTKQILTKLIHDYKSKMKAARYNVTQFNRKNTNWMQAYITFLVDSPSLPREGNNNKRGRPSKHLTDSSFRSKRRKTEEIRKKYTPEELLYAAQMEYRKEGQLVASKMLKNISNFRPEKAKTYTNISNTHCQKQLTPEKALSLLLEAGLTKNQYNLIISYTQEANCNLFPNYETITKAKTACYPEDMSITEVCAEVSLQNLLNHTSKRLCLSLTEGLDNLTEKQRKNLCLVTKWGCDGSGCHSQYNQKFESSDHDDSYMFITSIVPIQLVCNEGETGRQLLVWQNPRPSSKRYCRALRLQLKQETTQISQQEAVYVENQINSLKPTVIQIGINTFIIKHNLKMTMVDGKLVNAVTGTTSAQRCYLCGLTTKDFNRIQYCLEKEIRQSPLELGISSIHAWIRFAECILHLGYRLSISRYQARGTELKNHVNSEKSRIQLEFFNKLGIHVDKPRPDEGTSTTGNVARSILRNADVTAEITGVHKDLIERCHIILCAVSSGYEINKQKFKKYCLMVAQKFVMLYPWYSMPTTVHKVLLHGSTIIENAEIAIGLLSEDAQETRNKDVRVYRERYSRKFSRILTLRDTYQKLLATSDPYITSLRKGARPLTLPQAALSLIKEPDV